MLKVNQFRLFEQFVQIAIAGPAGVDAGDLVCKAHKEELFELGLVTPKYGTGFRLTTEGLRLWVELRRIISYTNPWVIR